MFDPRAAEEIGASYELRLGEDHFRSEVGEGRFEVFRGAADRPEATIETTQPPWPRWSTMAAPSRRRCVPGTWRSEAPGRRWRFLTLVPLPEPVPPAIDQYGQF